AITVIFFSLDSSAKESTSRPHRTKSSNRLSSSADGIPVCALSPNPIRQHLSPNTENSRHLLQRSPSSTTPPVTLNPQAAGFRSQRGSVSFDTQTPLTNSPPTTNKTKTTTPYSIIPTIITKPRLKLSMVRDQAVASLSHNAPVYSMPIT